jgi:hypothetical protein
MDPNKLKHLLVHQAYHPKHTEQTSDPNKLNTPEYATFQKPVSSFPFRFLLIPSTRKKYQIYRLKKKPDADTTPISSDAIRSEWK